MHDFGYQLDSSLSINVTNSTPLLSQSENSQNTESYALAFWDHGGARSGYDSDENTADSDKQQILTLSALFKALSNGIEATYFGRLYLLRLCACIMANYYILYPILDVDDPSIAQYYLASDVSKPNEGWNYIEFMAVDNATRTTNTPIDHGIAIIDKIPTAHYGARYTLLDSDKGSAFINKFDALIKMMTYAINNYDYAMLMSVLHGKSNCLAAAYFYIYDF